MSTGEKRSRKKKWDRAAKRFVGDSGASQPLARGRQNITYDAWLKRANAGQVRAIRGEAQGEGQELKTTGQVLKRREREEKTEAMRKKAREAKGSKFGKRPNTQKGGKRNAQKGGKNVKKVTKSKNAKKPARKSKT